MTPDYETMAKDIMENENIVMFEIVKLLNYCHVQTTPPLDEVFSVLMKSLLQFLNHGKDSDEYKATVPGVVSILFNFKVYADGSKFSTDLTKFVGGGK